MTADGLAIARSFLSARDYGGAEEKLRSILPADPDYGAAQLLLGRCAEIRYDWRAVLRAAHISIETEGETLEALRLLAVAERGLHNFPAAVTALEKLIAFGPAQKDLVGHLRNLAYSLFAVGRRPEGIEVQRQAIALQPEGTFLTELAEFLFKENRKDEAAEAAREAIRLDPGQARSRGLLTMISTPGTAKRRQKWLAWPGRTSAFEDARSVIQSSLLRGYPEGEPFITPTTRFMTLGSCFAYNLAKRLRTTGLEVFSEFIGEEVNSTYANKHFLRWVENGVSDASTQLMENAYGEELRSRYREAAKACEVFVFTLGVAPCFFHAETGEFFFMSLSGATQRYLFDNFVMRTTSVDENVTNLYEIIETIRRLSGSNPHIVLTVSPVPLAATAEMQSPVMADCLSKSTLRLACEQVRSTDGSGRLHYWPSFEIVRWLGPHFAPMHPPVFGEQDSKTRHVSQWVVELIMDLFIETYSAKELPLAAE